MIESQNLIENYKLAVKQAFVCRASWEAAGKPWNCIVKEDYDKACEKSGELLKTIRTFYGDSSIFNDIVTQAILEAR